MDTLKTIVGLSGSLRKGSVNSIVLGHLKMLAELETNFVCYEKLDQLPFFSPELDLEKVTDSVKEFRTVIRNADAVVICTPEYAFGVPGVLKNALDWLVSSADIYRKPVVTISASPTPLGGDKAHDSLRLTLTALGVTFLENGMLIIPTVKQKINTEGLIVDEDLQRSLHKINENLLSYLK